MTVRRPSSGGRRGRLCGVRRQAEEAGDCVASAFRRKIVPATRRRTIPHDIVLKIFCPTVLLARARPSAKSLDPLPRGQNRGKFTLPYAGARRNAICSDTGTSASTPRTPSLAPQRLLRSNRSAVAEAVLLRRALPIVTTSGAFPCAGIRRILQGESVRRASSRHCWQAPGSKPGSRRPHHPSHRRAGSNLQHRRRPTRPSRRPHRRAGRPFQTARTN